MKELRFKLTLESEYQKNMILSLIIGLAIMKFPCFRKKNFQQQLS